jgi:hypothetical protein
MRGKVYPANASAKWQSCRLLPSDEWDVNCPTARLARSIRSTHCSTGVATLVAGLGEAATLHSVSGIRVLDIQLDFIVYRVP